MSKFTQYHTCTKQDSENKRGRTNTQEEAKPCAPKESASPAPSITNGFKNTSVATLQVHVPTSVHQLDTPSHNLPLECLSGCGPHVFKCHCPAL